MEAMYIIGLVSILFLFIWKKYTTHTKRRNEYIKYLQEQNQKLQSVIQEEEPRSTPSMPDLTDGYPNDMINVESEPIQEDVVEINESSTKTMEIPPEISFMLHQFPGQTNETLTKIEEIDDDFVDMNDEESDDNCEEPYFETDEDPEKVPLDNLVYENDNDENDDDGKCCLKPLLEENFVDVPDALYDKPSTTVSENDDSGIKAANSDDNRKYLDKDEELEESLDALIQTKQMHCTAILTSGKNKGNMCKKNAKMDGLCKIHHKN